MIDIQLNNDIGFVIKEETLIAIVRSILTDHDVQRGEVSLAIIDDPTMHVLNRQHLQHDYPTDVLSFVLDDDSDAFEGEVIVSRDTALSMACEYQWSAEDEMLLYFVHGTLHLVGYDDHSDADRQTMRERETYYLNQVNIATPSDHASRMMGEGRETQT